jgi:hypothetical protein
MEASIYAHTSEHHQISSLLSLSFDFAWEKKRIHSSTDPFLEELVYFAKSLKK